MISAHTFSFETLDGNMAFVLGDDGNLWLETGPWGTVPPARTQVDGNVAACQPLGPDSVYVLGSDGNLWLETGPWGTVPPARTQVDGNVINFQALDATQVYVLGSDRNLWFESGPWGTVPPQRTQVDGNVNTFQALDPTHVYVLGDNENLWFESGPWGTIPPQRTQVDGNVINFQALDTAHAYVLGSNGNLWFESGPWGTVPPPRTQVDGNVFRFQPLDASHAYILGSDSKLWFETGPWGTVPPPRQQVDANVSPLTLQSTALQIALDWPSITFNNGVPVGGYASVVMNSNGSCTFAGHFHDSGFLDYDVAIAWVVVSDNIAYTFTAQGSMQGTIANLFNPNRDWNFQEQTTNQTVAANWSNLTAGYSWQAQASANLDLIQVINDLLNDLKAAGQIIQTVIQVIGTAAGT
jgi:hypothetical protein